MWRKKVAPHLAPVGAVAPAGLLAHGLEQPLVEEGVEEVALGEQGGRLARHLALQVLEVEVDQRVVQELLVAAGRNNKSDGAGRACKRRRRQKVNRS